MDKETIETIKALGTTPLFNGWKMEVDSQHVAIEKDQFFVNYYLVYSFNERTLAKYPVRRFGVEIYEPGCPDEDPDYEISVYSVGTHPHVSSNGTPCFGTVNSLQSIETPMSIALMNVRLWADSYNDADPYFRLPAYFVLDKLRFVRLREFNIIPVLRDDKIVDGIFISSLGNIKEIRVREKFALGENTKYVSRVLKKFRVGDVFVTHTVLLKNTCNTCEVSGYKLKRKGEFEKVDLRESADLCKKIFNMISVIESGTLASFSSPYI